MAAKSWEVDFRYAAIRESIKALEEEPCEDVFDFTGSLCLPIAKKPIVGWTPGRIFIIMLVLGFVGLGSAAMIAGQAQRNEKLGKPNQAWFAPVATCLGISGMAMFFAPIMLDRFIMRMLVGSRAASLTPQGEGKLFCAEISNTDRSKMGISIDGDDYVLMLVDYPNHRLLIEGVAARYMIRQEDVLSIQPFEFMNYVGTELNVHISDDVTLGLAIARVSILLEVIRQIPIFIFLKPLIRNRIHTECTRAVGPPVS